MSSEEPLKTNLPKLEEALRSIGYSFETAVADIIDNSIDEDAENILVRIICRRDGLLDLIVWDDGNGMAPKTLREAMSLGADISREIERLGKFGLGLKLASLSQARELRVITEKNGILSGRAYLEHGIAKGVCTVFNEQECREFISEAIPDKSIKPSGTLIWWAHLYRIGHHQEDQPKHAQKLLARLKNSLSITFHRYLSGQPRKVHIALDINGHGDPVIPARLDPLDPFNYEGRSGHPGFPAKMLVEGIYQDKIGITAHVWPPNSERPEYKLPGGSNRRQGFYFYRNNRLIQGGGWNELREAEPHSSLARLEVDLRADLDSKLSLDVKKVEIQLPPDIASAMRTAKTRAGVDFKKYLSIAADAYRKRSVIESELPLIPSDGLPSKLAEFLHSELRHEKTTKHRDLKFKWETLGRDQFFDIERDSGLLLLNRIYRRQLQHGLPGSSADIPIVKCLLFLVLEDVLSSERMGPKLRERCEKVNRILVQAVKYERTPE